MSVNVKINDSFRKKLDAVRLRKVIHEGMTKATLTTEREVMKEAPEKTGNLRRSHSTQVIANGSMVEGLVKNSTKYWQYVNFGHLTRDGLKHIPANNFVHRGLVEAQPLRVLQGYINSNFVRKH